jgi:hypothetical protein
VNTSFKQASQSVPVLQLVAKGIVAPAALESYLPKNRRCPQAVGFASLPRCRDSGDREDLHRFDGVLAAVAAVVCFKRNRPKGARHHASSIGHPLDLLRQSRLAFGALCIFLCVGGEVIASEMQESRVLGVDAGVAGFNSPWYSGGALVGRFIGSALLKMVSPGKVLSANAVGAITLDVVSVLSHGSFAACTLLLVGLMN